MGEVPTDQWIEEVSERALSVFQRPLSWRQIESRRVLYTGKCLIAMANFTPDVRVQRQLLTGSSSLDHHSLIVGGKIYTGEEKVISFHFGIYRRDVPEAPGKQNGRFIDSRVENPNFRQGQPLESYQYEAPLVELYDYKTSSLSSISSNPTYRPWDSNDAKFVEEVLDSLDAPRVENGLKSIRDQLVPFLNSISVHS